MARKGKGKLRSSRYKGKALRRAEKDLTIDPPSYSKAVEEISSLRRQLKEVKESNEKLKGWKKEGRERRERRDATPTRASSSSRSSTSTVKRTLPSHSDRSISDYEEDIPIATGKARVQLTTSKLTEQEEEELLMDH